MAATDLLRPAVGMLHDSLRKILHGSVTLTVHVRAGRIVRTVISKSESFECRGSEAAVTDAAAGQDPVPRSVTRVLEGCRG